MTFKLKCGIYLLLIQPSSFFKSDCICKMRTSFVHPHVRCHVETLVSELQLCPRGTWVLSFNVVRIARVLLPTGPYSFLHLLFYLYILLSFLFLYFLISNFHFSILPISSQWRLLGINFVLFV